MVRYSIMVFVRLQHITLNSGVTSRTVQLACQLCVLSGSYGSQVSKLSTIMLEANFKLSTTITISWLLQVCQVDLRLVLKTQVD